MATKQVCDGCEKDANYVVEFTDQFFPAERREGFREFLDMDDWTIDWCGNHECLKQAEAEMVLKLDAHWAELIAEGI